MKIWTQKLSPQNLKLLRSMERTFTSMDTTFSKIYGKQQLEKQWIVPGGHETSMIDTQFMINTQFLLTIAERASLFNLEDHQLVSSNETEPSSVSVMQFFIDVNIRCNLCWDPRKFFANENFYTYCMYSLCRNSYSLK